ncbi:hypothetical protein ACFVAV_34005 [Nocardia sp. NPDC057663]|uniref:hypothetical protein n=1 Tax=Nocardia sp. NPDC057663 TaxID=3346201 RepID=UPI00366E3223
MSLRYERTQADVRNLDTWLSEFQLNGEFSIEVTAALTDQVAKWGESQGWDPRFEVPSLMTFVSKAGKTRRGRLDIVFDRPGQPALAVEIDSRNNERALAKLATEASGRGSAAIWLRWGPRDAAPHSYTGASGLDPSLTIPPPIVMAYLDVMCHKKQYYRPSIEIQVRPPTSVEELEAARTRNGGWTRDQLAEWGIPFPPPSGWHGRLLRAIRQQTPQLEEGEHADG